ncbi:MAG: hypothetical protein JKY17_02685 [Magnetovibrio sp.]|nr:hypothetical protein [Magnetovibrio sp.]
MNDLSYRHLGRAGSSQLDQGTAVCNPERSVWFRTVNLANVNRACH